MKFVDIKALFAVPKVSSASETPNSGRPCITQTYSLPITCSILKTLKTFLIVAKTDDKLLFFGARSKK